MTVPNAKGLISECGKASSLPQYDVSYFASKHRLSIAKARQIMDRAGESRRRADAIAEREKNR
jgi:hypothetical protein